MHSFDNFAILFFHFQFMLEEGKRKTVSLRQRERHAEAEKHSAVRGHNLELYFIFVYLAYRKHQVIAE